MHWLGAIALPGPVAEQVSPVAVPLPYQIVRPAVPSTKRYQGLSNQCSSLIPAQGSGRLDRRYAQLQLPRCCNGSAEFHRAVRYLVVKNDKHYFGGVPITRTTNRSLCIGPRPLHNTQTRLPSGSGATS